MQKYLLLLLTNFIFINSLLAQGNTGTIQGRVTSSDGEPVPGVNVLIRGTTRGSSTQEDGFFSIENIKSGVHTLQISAIGLEKREQTVEVKAGETTIVPDILLKENAQQLSEIIISDYKSVLSDIKRSEFVAKMPLKNLENPQVYNTVSSKLMEEQVVTNFDDALRNVPGIERLWESTGRGGDGAAYYALRGFETQATMVNGLPGLTNGSLDPANIERIEVIKGPSGTLYGSSLISYGGLINTVTKQPYQYFGGQLTYIAGSFGLNRITADINTPLSKEKEIALRINTAYHSENSFQDAGFKKSFFIAPSLSYQVNDKLSFLINTEFLAAEGTNPTMLFLNRSNPLQFENLEDLNYNPELSLTSNDLSIKNPRYNLQAQMHYKISDRWTSQTAVARGAAVSDGYYSYLWDNWFDKGEFSVFISDQNAQTTTTDIQQNFIGDFNLGEMRNRMVIGVDYFHREVTDNSTGYPWLLDITPQGEINYVDPYTGDTLAPRYFSHQSVDAILASYDRSNSNSKDATYSAYISDVINVSPQLLVMASLRIDHFDTEGDITTDEDDYNQTALSPKFGLIYQPIQDKLSLFANYMNGFKNVAPAQVADVGGDNPRTKTFEPEHANQWELGIKTNLFSDKLISTFSYYDINVSNVVISDPENVNNSIQGGEVESKGFEMDITAQPVAGLNIIVGYSYNDSKILEGDEDGIWFQEGKRPVSSGPQNLFNTWATYQVTDGAIRGFGLGLGANYASELIVIDSDATGKFTLPSYTVLNTSIFYDTQAFRISLNINNVTDKEYYKGYSTINPQKPGNVSASFTYRF